MDFQYIRANGVDLHVGLDGPIDGPLLLLLHGFPEMWYCWRNQIAHFAAAGFRVMAPDQRGYNLSEKPRSLDAYLWHELAADVIGLIDAANRDQAILVGHDWGGSVAWYAANQYPSRVQRLVLLNSPHPLVMRRHLRKSFSQKRKSWYMYFFQLPRLPEKLLSMSNWALLRRALIRSSLPGTFQERDLAEYQKAWSQPNAVESMVAWYRAAMSRNTIKLKRERISIPTLILWGAQDHFLDLSMAKQSLEWCDRGSLVVFQDSTHWLQEEQAAKVNEQILKFITR
jgi:pimeloyl-ACP methyl ester carboxylesterase